VEETEDPTWSVRVEAVLKEHGLTVRVLSPAELGAVDDGLIGIQVPLAEFDTALIALEDLDELDGP
jgi:hypothetical protein